MGRFTYKGEQFYKNGEPMTVLAGAMHYFRIPREYWRDRLTKLKECGFNTVETYTAWNLHEPREGDFDFSGNLDISAYIALAEELGLNVIVRPGPYICAEWEFGGFPAWLLTYEEMALRCNDTLYLSKVERYFTALLAELKPHLISNGGNLIMLQIENEYGSYGNDKDYLRAIVDIYRKCGMDCLLFTSDGPRGDMLSGGTLDGYLSVGNFGSHPEENLEALQEYRTGMPTMCGEYWVGWFDHWFEKHHTKTAAEICDDFEGFFRMKASMNFYMFHGGTNFGFMNGANYSDKYEPTVTSYDYCALLTEAGDRTEAYYRVRDIIARYCGGNALLPLTARESEKKAYGNVVLTESADLFENIEKISRPVKKASPVWMEDVGQGYGYTLYRTRARGFGRPARLVIERVHDRAEIFADGEKLGTYERWKMPTNEERVVIDRPLNTPVQIDILNENMGRVNYGPHLRDRKGIREVRLDFQNLFGWEIFPLPMEDLSGLCFSPVAPAQTFDRPTFLRGTLRIGGEPADTFLRLDGFQKGFVRINGKNVGRYFNEAGPQKTLYVPAPFLREGENEILVFESDGTTSRTVTFTDTPDLG